MRDAPGSSRDLVVGYDSHNYGGAHNTYAPVPGVKYVKMRRIPFEYTPGREHLGLHRVFAPLGPNPDVDLVHLWNRVSVGRTPWGVSFEDTLPYLNPRIHTRAIPLQRNRLLSDQCRFIVGMSDYAVRQFRSTLSDSEWSQIANKVHRVYPHHTRPTRSSSYPDLNDSDSLRLLFVGVSFFGKGGEAVLRAVEAVGDELNLQLTIVSAVTGSDYDGTPPADVDVSDVQRRLDANPRVTWHKRLPHAEVMTAIENHHLGLLPTFADTFGYVVLEYMSLGVPSIVSDVQALPEFTGPDTGWQVNVVKDERGVWLGRHPDLQQRRDHYFSTVTASADALVTILRSIRSNPEDLQKKSVSTRSRFEDQFDPIRRGEKLRAVYAESAM